VKFTPPGGHIELQVRRNPDATIELVVRDTGIGMSPADIPRALQPFVQLDNRLSRRYEGSGLGLPLTASLVELHGGILDLQSSLGEGTTATVHFPATRTIADDAPSAPAACTSGNASS
jgi:signal transduction histidine kinase